MKLTSDEIAAPLRDPVLFTQYILRRQIWKVQKQIARSVQRNLQTAVKGCHASGKTFLAAGLPLWALTLGWKVFTIAPTLRQVKMFWKEVSLARRDSLLTEILPEPSTTGLSISEECYALGTSSSRGVNLQGFHGKNVLIIADEAPGIDAEIWDAIEGVRLGGNVHIISLGNPVVPSGDFHSRFHRGRATNNCITISAFDTPNLQNEFTGKPLTIEEILTMDEERLAHTPFPALITRQGVKERYLTWGPSNPRYISRVLAEFPTQSQRAVFDLAWIERAKREPTDQETNRAKGCYIQVGIDVAGEGSDETAGCARVNGIILARQAWPDADPRGAVIRWLVGLRNTFGHLYPLGPVVCDTVGLGYNFALHLADQNFIVYGFKAGSEPMDKEQFKHASAEQYFRLREMYQKDYVCHGDGAIDEDCEAQLSTLEYEELSIGKIRIEPKDQAKRRGVPSPDRAEAEMLAFCRIIPREQTEIYGGAYQISAI